MKELTWGLLIATKDRIDPLCNCVSLALAQTRRPHEIVVADASADWEANCDRVTKIIAAHPFQPRLVYLRGAAPSLAVQRNQAMNEATADVFFMIDDDSFMHHHCAAEIMQIYEADPENFLAGVQATESPINPCSGPAGSRKSHGVDLSRFRSKLPMAKWLLDHFLMRSKTSVFIPYDKAFSLPTLPPALQRLDVFAVELFGGFRMTYRAQAIRQEGFDTCLRYYCPGEDLDASYRASRYGALVTARRARLYHHASAAGRLKRTQIAHLWSLNQAVLLRRHAADQRWANQAWHRKMLHRIFTDLIKDALMRRFKFPQARGTWRAWRDGYKVFQLSPTHLENWYPEVQERIVKS